MNKKRKTIAYPLHQPHPILLKSTAIQSATERFTYSQYTHTQADNSRRRHRLVRWRRSLALSLSFSSQLVSGAPVSARRPQERDTRHRTFLLPVSRRDYPTNQPVMEVSSTVLFPWGLLFSCEGEKREVCHGGRCARICHWNCADGGCGAEFWWLVLCWFSSSGFCWNCKRNVYEVETG